MTIRQILPALIAALTFPALAASAQTDYSVPAFVPAHIRNAVESDRRDEEHRQRDAARKPAEVLTLADLNEGDRIAEISAFGQYYSTIIADAVGPRGMLYMYDMPYMEQFGAVENGNSFADARDNTEYEVVHYSEIALPEDLDAVYNVLYYHDLQPQDVDTAEMNEKILDALRPGGKYLVVDHKAEEGSGWRDADTIHRMEKQAIIDEITGAGFELISDSDILAHPEDDRTAMVFEPGIRGGTDRAVLVFRKPW